MESGKDAVQQFKITRIRKVDNALNQKRRNIFGVKTNCETVSKGPKTNSSYIIQWYSIRTMNHDANEITYKREIRMVSKEDTLEAGKSKEFEIGEKGLELKSISAYYPDLDLSIKLY